MQQMCPLCLKALKKSVVKTMVCKMILRVKCKLGFGFMLFFTLETSDKCYHLNILKRNIILMSGSDGAVQFQLSEKQ